MTTDTQPLAPTDAEIDELRQANSGRLNFVTFSEFRTIARAALAKWGAQPVHSGEPVAYTVAGPVTDWSRDFSAYKTKTYVRPVFTAPKTVEREPLSDEIVDSLCKVGPVYPPEGKVTRTPAQYRDELEAAQRYGLRKGERAHGIKGGQHGIDT